MLSKLAQQVQLLHITPPELVKQQQNQHQQQSRLTAS